MLCLFRFALLDLVACLAWFGLPSVVSAASSGVVLAGLWGGGSALDAMLGHFPAPFGEAKNLLQKRRTTRMGSAIWGHRLKGFLELKKPQKQHLEITDSSRELLKQCFNMLL